MKKWRNFWFFIGVIIFIIASILIISMFSKTTGNAASIPAIAINYGNMEDIMSRLSLVQALPEDGSILLKFYNFDSGSRVWEKSYILKKGSVIEGEENADIILSIHSKYLSILNTQNFCGVIQTAKNNGDLGMDTSLSAATLLWKYKGVMKYKSCFGL